VQGFVQIHVQLLVRQQVFAAVSVFSGSHRASAKVELCLTTIPL
jgi:hypothetical protein